jgi:ABC-2 type transport system permease protein
VTFAGVLRAEFVKLFSTRLWWVLALILFGYIAVTAGILAGVLGGLGDSIAASGGNAPQVPAGELHLIVYSVASTVGYVFPVLLGALTTTSEFRHETLTPTFLASPRRVGVLTAKLVTMAIAGVGLGLVSLVASIGVGAPILAATGNDAALGAEATWLLVGRLLLAMALWAVIGVGLGVLIPSQVAAIVVVLAFTQFVEPILRAAASVWDWTAEVGQFLPGAASDALVGSSIFTSLAQGPTVARMLEWWQGGLVLLGIAVVAAAVGYFTSWRSDVT